MDLPPQLVLIVNIIVSVSNYLPLAPAAAVFCNRNVKGLKSICAFSTFGYVFVCIFYSNRDDCVVYLIRRYNILIRV